MTNGTITHIDKLKALETHFSVFDESRNARLERLGRALGNELTPRRQFSRHRLYSVYNGNQSMGVFLEAAIDSLYLQLISGHLEVRND